MRIISRKSISSYIQAETENQIFKSVVSAELLLQKTQTLKFEMVIERLAFTFNWNNAVFDAWNYIQNKHGKEKSKMQTYTAKLYAVNPA